jgi:hypothetical protein
VNRVGARERERETWLDGSFVDHSVLLLLYNKPKPRRSNELTPLAMNVRQGKERFVIVVTMYKQWLYAVNHLVATMTMTMTT